MTKKDLLKKLKAQGITGDPNASVKELTKLLKTPEAPKEDEEAETKRVLKELAKFGVAKIDPQPSLKVLKAHLKVKQEEEAKRIGTGVHDTTLTPKEAEKGFKRIKVTKEECLKFQKERKLIKYDARTEIAVIKE